MRMIFAIAVVTLMAVPLSGCGCNRPFANWFNRGDRCDVDPCATGVLPRATVSYPATIPPGAEILPVPSN